MDPLNPIDMAILAKAIDNESGNNKEPNGCGYVVLAIIIIVPMFFELLLICNAIFHLFEHKSMFFYEIKINWENAAWTASGVTGVLYILIHYFAKKIRWVRIFYTPLRFYLGLLYPYQLLAINTI